MSFKPVFEYLKPPSPDQTTLTQYLPKRSTGRIDPCGEPTANPNVKLPPPAKLPPPSNNSQESMNHKKQPNYHNKYNRIHIGAYVYSRVGELHKAHPSQKRRVRSKKFGIVVESISSKEWHVKFDDNTKLTLKSSQIRVCESKTPGHVYEPCHEDQSQVNELSSSYSFNSSQKKKTTKRILDNDFENENNYNMTSSSSTSPATASITTTTTAAASTATTTTTGSSASSATPTTPAIMLKSTPTTTTNDDDDDSYVGGDVEEDELFVRNELEGNEDELSISDDDDDLNLNENFVPQQEEQDIHDIRLSNTRRKIRGLQGMTTDVVNGTGRNKKSLTWEVIPYHDAPDPIKARSKAALGIRSQQTLDDLFDSDLPLADLFLLLTFRGGKWQRWLRVLNDKVKEMNESDNVKRNVSIFSPQEFLIGHALMICAADCSDRGTMLWDEKKTISRQDKAWQSLAEKTLFSPYMKSYRFKQFRKLIPLMWEADDIAAQQDPWYKFRAAVDNFNSIRKHDIVSSERRVLDESMSAYRPRTTKLGGLPNISYILRKPEPLGTEFKTSVCPRLNVMTFMEICEGKYNMRTKPFQKQLGGTTACTVRMAQGTCQTSIDQSVEVVSGDSWFGSVKSVLNIKKHCMYQKESVFSVKTAHSLFPKSFIEDILAKEPGGASIVLRSVLEDVPLIAIGYKYNKKRVLHFVMSENAGSTTDGDPYQMKFADQFGNIHIREIPRPEVISTYFQDSNCVDVHNQLRQYALRLEKKWVTTNPYFRLHTTLIGINVIDTFQLATFHGIIGRQNRLYEEDADDDEEKNITAIQRFGGILARQLVMMANGFDERRNRQFLARMNCLGSGMVGNSFSQESNEWDENEREEGEEEDNVSAIDDGGGSRVSIFSDVAHSASTVQRDEGDESADEQQSIERNKKRERNTVLVDSVTDRLGNTHQAVKNPWKLQVKGSAAGKGYTPAYPCCLDGCNKRSRVHCYQCNKVYCFSLNDDKKSHIDGSTGMVIGDRMSCFYKHVHETRRKSRR
jgi:hypothetical protein